MSTRSAIATPLDNGFRGRYCHGDGEPTFMGRELHAIVRRDGIERARRILIEEHSAWSNIYADVERGRTVAEYSNPDLSEFVPGYGQILDHPNKEWWIDNKGSDCGTEWAYVLNDDALSVLQRMHRDDSPAVGMLGFNDDAGYWMHVGDLRYDQDIDDAALGKMECGANFERCIHVVWFHLPDAPEEVRDKGMRKWMGHDPRDWNAVTAFRIGGTWIPTKGSGGIGSARDHDYRTLARSATPYWWASLTIGGEYRRIRVARILKDGRYTLDVPAKLMPTRSEPEVVVPKGATL